MDGVGEMCVSLVCSCVLAKADDARGWGVEGGGGAAAGERQCGWHRGVCAQMADLMAQHWRAC